MDHDLELIVPGPGNSGSYDPYISPILEIVDRTIQISVLSWKYWIVRSICQSYMLMSRVAGGRGGPRGARRRGACPPSAPWPGQSLAQQGTRGRSNMTDTDRATLTWIGRGKDPGTFIPRCGIPRYGYPGEAARRPRRPLFIEAQTRLQAS